MSKRHNKYVLESLNQNKGVVWWRRDWLWIHGSCHLHLHSRWKRIWWTLAEIEFEEVLVTLLWCD